MPHHRQRTIRPRITRLRHYAPPGYYPYAYGYYPSGYAPRYYGYASPPAPYSAPQAYVQQGYYAARDPNNCGTPYAPKPCAR